MEEYLLEQLVPYPLALKLKELEFYEGCMCIYNNGKPSVLSDSSMSKEFKITNKGG